MRLRTLAVVTLAAALSQPATASVVAAPAPSVADQASSQSSVDSSAPRTGFNVIKKHRRGKAQMCRYTFNGYRYILTRANSKEARTRLTYRLRINEWDGVENDWDPSYPARKRVRVGAHRVRHVHTAGGPQLPRVRVQILSRTGHTTWSAWKRYRDLRNCPDWYVENVMNPRHQQGYLG